MADERKATLHRLTPAGPIFEPESEVIEHLERLLKMAQAGEIKGFGVFYVTRADGVISSWSPGCAQANHMLAGAAKLEARIAIAQIYAEDRPSELAPRPA